MLYLSSPIGLGHARRDLAIARELRAQRGDVQIDWLTQHPVTAFLEQAGESVHPAAARCAPSPGTGSQSGGRASSSARAAAMASASASA